MVVFLIKYTTLFKYAILHYITLHYQISQCVLQGLENGNTEVACQSTMGSTITTGGGFSHVYTLPDWQANEVRNYFTLVSGTSKAPQSGYDPTKRGYPDISALANRYQVVANGLTYVGKKRFCVRKTTTLYLAIQVSFLSPITFMLDSQFPARLPHLPWSLV